MIGDHDVSNADMSDALDGSMTRGRGDASRLSRRAVSRRAVVLATVAGASVAACNTLPTTPGTPDRPGPACREPLGPELPTTGNIRVSRDGCRSHAEPNLAVNPRDPRNLLGACIANGGSAITAYASFDGGVTWRSHGALEDSANGRDPSVSFDAAGRGYICANTDDLHVWRTDDGGRGFAAPTLATRGHKLDHPWLAADPTPGPPSATHLYAAWTGPDNTQLEFARSTDAGRGFEAPRALDTVRGPDQASIASPMLAAGPGGTIHIVYGVWPPLPQQGQGLRPEFPAPIRAISSTDRGQTWTEPAQLGIGVMEIRVTSDTNVPGLPAVVTHRKEAFAAAAFVVRQPGAPFTDIAVCVSRDRGRRWTAPRLVPRRGDDIIYTQPQLAIDESGRLALSAFAHRRGLVDVVVILADPGTSRFGPPTVVTSRPFDPARGGGQGKHGAWWIGDYQGLASAAGTVYPFWNDARYPGRLEIFAERMPTSNGIPSPSRSPSG